MLNFARADAPRFDPREPCVILVDNGSLAAASTLQLRRIAAALQRELAVPVLPASLAHSAAVAAAELEGEPARQFELALDCALAGGVREIVVAPLFVGPSHAITRHVPAVLAARRASYPDARILLARPLSAPGDTRLARRLTDHIREQLENSANANAIAAAGVRPRVVVVDHGSPSAEVAKVRDDLTAEVRRLLGSLVGAVSPASMERRPGPEYDFNEPLLESLLGDGGWRVDPLVVALLFIGPGRHAGPGGDVERIVARARGGTLAGVAFTRLLGEHPGLIGILADRANESRAPRRSFAFARPRT